MKARIPRKRKSDHQDQICFPPCPLLNPPSQGKPPSGHDRTAEVRNSLLFCCFPCQRRQPRQLVLSHSSVNLCHSSTLPTKFRDIQIGLTQRDKERLHEKLLRRYPMETCRVAGFVHKELQQSKRTSGAGGLEEQGKAAFCNQET